MKINRETLDEVLGALDAATNGPWRTVGSTHCNGVGGDFDSQPGAFKLVCGDSTGANCDAISAAVNWLRENRDALTAQPAAAQEAVEDASNIIELLLTLAYAAWSLADNADGGSGNDNVSVDRRDFDKVSEALDALDELPDDQPGYVMEAAAKARWALRGILASPVAAAPVDPNGLILDLRAAVSIGRPLLHSDVDEIERALASAPAAPGIDLEQFRALVEACEDMRAASEECDIGEGLAHAVPFHLWNAFLSKLDAAQQALDASPKGGSDALARAYGYLWHVNHPEDIPAGHPYMSADRAAVEARKELRDMLTHEQRGEGINRVRQKLLADMQATSAEVGE